MNIFNIFKKKKSSTESGLFTDQELESFIKKVNINSKGGKLDIKTIKEFAAITMDRMVMSTDSEDKKPPSYYLEKRKRKQKK